MAPTCLPSAVRSNASLADLRDESAIPCKILLDQPSGVGQEWLHIDKILDHRELKAFEHSGREQFAHGLAD